MEIRNCTLYGVKCKKNEAPSPLIVTFDLIINDVCVLCDKSMNVNNQYYATEYYDNDNEVNNRSTNDKFVFSIKHLHHQ